MFTDLVFSFLKQFETDAGPVLKVAYAHIQRIDESIFIEASQVTEIENEISSHKV